MKKILAILTLTLTVINLFGQNNPTTNEVNEKSFPINLSERKFKKLEKFNGKVVAFEGIIMRIENSRNNTPFYKLKIGESNYLWAVLMFKNEVNKMGDKVRVVGYLNPAVPNETEKTYLDGKYMVIAFGLVDFKNSNVLMLEGKQKQEWISGKIPSSK